MSEVKVTPSDNGPLIVTGEIQLLDAEGKQIATKQTTYFCRCGQSANKPFCNGAHRGNFESVVRA